MNPIFINLPTPSFNRKLIWRHFDSPDNPDNLGYIRCKTCYARFPDSFRESEMIEQDLGLKCSAWIVFGFG